MNVVNSSFVFQVFLTSIRLKDMVFGRGWMRLVQKYQGIGIGLSIVHGFDFRFGIDIKWVRPVSFQCNFLFAVKNRVGGIVNQFFCDSGRSSLPKQLGKLGIYFHKLDQEAFAVFDNCHCRAVNDYVWNQMIEKVSGLAAVG